VSEHVRMPLEAQLGLGSCSLHHASEASGREWCPAFLREHEGRLGLLLALEASQGA
jgi:hypothetical protein